MGGKVVFGEKIRCDFVITLTYNLLMTIRFVIAGPVVSIFIITELNCENVDGCVNSLKLQTKSMER